MAGQGGLILLASEPGIRKAALCEQLTGFAAMEGGLPLIGHCYPEGSAGVPYQPFVDAFEALARLGDAQSLRTELGSGATLRSWWIYRAKSLTFW